MKELLAAFVLGELSESESSGVAEHLSRCETCRQEVQRLKKILACTERLKNVQADPKACATALRAVMAAVRRDQIRPVQAADRSFWRTMPSRRVAQFAAAACIAFVIVLGITLIDNYSEVAWGRLAERLEKIAAYSYKSRYFVSRLSGKPIHIKRDDTIYYSAQYGIRSYSAGVLFDFSTYTSFADGTSTFVIPYIGKYVRWNLDPDQLLELKETNDPLSLMKYMMTFRYTRLERDNFNGVEVDGIEVTDPGFGKDFLEQCTARMWASVETGMPVYFELKGTADKGEIETILTLFNFKWNQQLEPAMFKPDIPADYILAAEVDAQPTSEKTVMQGLEKFASLREGRYPVSLVKTNIQSEVIHLFADQTANSPLGRTLLFMEDEDFDWEAWALLIWQLNTACAFYGNLERDERDVAYYGRFVTAENSDLPLLRWKVSKGEYRVIWGNLHATNISAADLAELEKDLQK